MILLFERAGWGMPQEWWPFVQGPILAAILAFVWGFAWYHRGFRAGMRHAERKTKEFEHLRK